MGDMKHKVLYRGGTGEIVEKKSRFIATTMPVKNEEEALRFIEELRKKYWNATHNCFAYVVGEQNHLQRCSDDGEPSQTAGRPMLEVLLGEGIHDAAVVVTRYFGGTLLGTGGLVRAYAAAVKEGLRQSVVLEKTAGIRMKIQTDYAGLGKIQYILGRREIVPFKCDYTQEVCLEVAFPGEQKEQLLKEWMEATNGQVKILEEEACSYGNHEGEYIFF